MARKTALFLVPALLAFLLIIPLVFVCDEEEGSTGSEETLINVSAEVLAYRPLVTRYCSEYGIPEYVDYILAIMQVESGGKGKDVMQSSESLGLPPNSLEPEDSIRQGCACFATLATSAKANGCDINAAIQAYNYGGSYIPYVAGRGKRHTFELAESFSKEKSGGVKVTYTNPAAVAKNGGWRYNYGNMFYVELVRQHIGTSAIPGEFAKAVFDEALKYEGYPYVFGGTAPSAFDCSSLTQWCYKAAGASIPRTAQAQYDAMGHISLGEAKAGDLLFFKGTYATSDYITHVGIYAGGGRMFHAGDPLGYTDINTPYWQNHFVCAGTLQ